MSMRAAIVIVILAAGCSPEQHAHQQPLDVSPVKAAGLAQQDRDFLERATQGNNAEVAIGVLATRRTSNGAVLQFAKTLTADHGSANRQLEAIAARYHIALPTALGDHQASFDRLASLHQEGFDEEFAKVMREDHQRAVDLYKTVLASGVDPQLKQYAAAMLPRIEAHLAHAKSLAGSR
jgi:putative membrane protein